MIKYSIITVLLLLLAFVAQQFLPTFTILHGSRILLVQLVFVSVAFTVGSPTMLLLAFIGGFLWDANYSLGDQLVDAETYHHPVESIRFGYSIVLFAAIGFIMKGIRPLFRQGRWLVSSLIVGQVIFIYLLIEFGIICFVRGGFSISKETLIQISYTSLLTMLWSPPLLFILSRLSIWCEIDQSDTQYKISKKFSRFYQ